MGILFACIVVCLGACGHALPILFQSGAVCGVPDRVAQVTRPCGITSDNSNVTNDWPALCYYNSVTLDSVMVTVMDLERYLMDNTPTPQKEWPNYVVGLDHPVELNDDQMKNLTNSLARYQLELFCLGDAIGSLDFDVEPNNQHLCESMQYNELCICNVAYKTKAVPAGDWISELEQCNIYKHNNRALANAYGIAVIRRFLKFLTAWWEKCQ